MTTSQEESRLHDWDKDEIKQFGNARCNKCGIQEIGEPNDNILDKR